MKINKTKPKKPLVVLAVSVVLLFLISGAFLFARQYGQKIPNNSGDGGTKSARINYEKPDKRQLGAGDDIKKATLNSAGQTAGAAEENYVVSITAANQTTSSVQIRSLIQGVIDNGTCTLELTGGGVSLTRSVGVQASANSTTCRGFDIPIGELSVGVWRLRLTFVAEKGSGFTTSSLEIK